MAAQHVKLNDGGKHGERRPAQQSRPQTRPQTDETSGDETPRGPVLPIGLAPVSFHGALGSAEHHGHHAEVLAVRSHPLPHLQQGAPDGWDLRGVRRRLGFHTQPVFLRVWKYWFGKFITSNFFF